MKNYNLLKTMLVMLMIISFSAGICFAQGAASPSTPKEKEEADKAGKAKNPADTVPLELTDPMVIAPAEEEKTEEAADPVEMALTPGEPIDGQTQEAQLEEEAKSIKQEKGQSEQEELPAVTREK